MCIRDSHTRSHRRLVQYIFHIVIYLCFCLFLLSAWTFSPPSKVLLYQLTCTYLLFVLDSEKIVVRVPVCSFMAVYVTNECFRSISTWSIWLQVSPSGDCHVPFLMSFLWRQVLFTIILLWHYRTVYVFLCLLYTSRCV